MSNISNTVEYQVTKITYAKKMCSYCGGTSKITRGYKDVTCPECKNGVATIQHQTSVNLIDALIDLKLIKPKPDETTNER